MRRSAFQGAHDGPVTGRVAPHRNRPPHRLVARVTIASVPLFRRKRPQPVSEGPPIRLLVKDDTHPFEGNDGRTYWCIGPAPVYEDTNGEAHYLQLGQELPDRRAIYCKVAGISFYAKALGDRRPAPGSHLKLKLEPDNVHDVNAVGVWDELGRVQAGHVPAELSAEVARRIRSGEQLTGTVLREVRRDSQSGPLVGLHILILPPVPLEIERREDC
jgi:hypothetical protein